MSKIDYEKITLEQLAAIVSKNYKNMELIAFWLAAGASLFIHKIATNLMI